MDSVENIQKVFYDKPVFIQDCANQSDSETSGNSNHVSDEDTEISVIDQLNIKTEEEIPPKNIIGDFEQEIEEELGRISLENQNLETAVIEEIEDAIDKIEEDLNDQLPIKYNIEPNLQDILNQSLEVQPDPIVLNDSEVVKALPLLETSPNKNQVIMSTKICDAFLSNAQESIPLIKDTHFQLDSNRELEEIECQIKKLKSHNKENKLKVEEFEKFSKEDVTKDYKEKDEDSAVPRKKEKIDYYVKKRKDYNQQYGSLITFPRREFGNRNRDVLNRRSVPMAKEKKRMAPEILGLLISFTKIIETDIKSFTSLNAVLYFFNFKLRINKLLLRIN